MINRLGCPSGRGVAPPEIPPGQLLPVGVVPPEWWLSPPPPPVPPLPPLAEACPGPLPPEGVVWAAPPFEPATPARPSASTPVPALPPPPPPLMPWD